MSSFSIFFKHCLIEMIRFVLSVVIPVKKGKLMFESYPDYSDNARAFSDFLLENTDYNVIWSVRDITRYKNSDRIRFVEKDGGKSLGGKLRFVYDTVSSQFLFSTHGSFLFANRIRQKYVVLWHGMPLKKIARLQSDDNRFYLDNASYVLSTSKYYIPILQQCFARESNEILSFGLPRNDLLFHENNSMTVLGIDKQKGEKMIVYLPTFRKVDGVSKGDTEEDVFNSLFDITTNESREKINCYLRELNVIMVVKPHPADSNVLEEYRNSNLIIIPHSYFADKDIQLYHVLHYADALLTDYSSAFIDYLNLDCPIGFVLTDINNYSENRGFIFDSPMEYLPGMQLFTEQDFKLFCEGVAKGKDNFKSERERLRYVYNDYSDANSCLRLAEYLGLSMQKSGNT